MESSTVHTLPEPELRSTAILTTTLALAAATMTFGALIAVFFIRSGGREWGHLEIPITLWFTTGILLASSVTVERARRALEHGEQARTYHRFLVELDAGRALSRGTDYRVGAGCPLRHPAEEITRTRGLSFFLLPCTGCTFCSV